MTSWSLFLSCSLVLFTRLQSVIGDSCTYYGDYNSLPVSTVTCSDHAPGLYSNPAWGYNSGTRISQVSQVHNNGQLYVTAWNAVTGDGDANHCLHCLQVSYGSKSVRVTVIDRKGASGVDLSDAAFDCLFGANAHVGGGNFAVTVQDLGAGPCAGGGGCGGGGGGTPTTTTAAPSGGSCKPYTVVSGDYGWLIASKLGVDFNTQLSPWNPTVNWGALQVGQVICGSAPGSSTPTTKAPTTTKAATTTAPSGGVCKKYTVVAGDTGWGIAQKLGVDFNTQLSVWNPKVVWTALTIGQQICASAGTAAAETTSGVSEDTQKWLIPLLVVVGILFIALLVILFRNSKQRGRSYSSEIGMQAIPKSETGTQAAKPVWEKRTDPSSGTTCYYNTATGQTQWEAPDDLNTVTTV
jgi:LysM repeat protein